MCFTPKKAICFIEQMSGKIDLHDKSNKALLYYLEMNERKDIFIHVRQDRCSGIARHGQAR